MKYSKYICCKLKLINELGSKLLTYNSTSKIISYLNYSRNDLGIKIVSSTRLEYDFRTVLVLELLYEEVSSKTVYL